jgi:SAM-dependent methyltransferase
VDSALAPNSGPSALAAYEALAPFYDRFTADYEHEPVLEQIEALALEHGLRGRRLLDVACGTGKSFLPLMRRGYDVTACDISPGMVELARRKLPPDAATRIVVADMRLLPWRGAFDLVTCLDDAVNYLLDPGELRAGLAGMRANLRPGGLLVFDVNTLATYRTVFCDGLRWGDGDETYASAGEPRPVETGGLFATTLQAWRGDTLVAESRHVQRHHGAGELERALHDAGLEPLELYGSAADGSPERPPDEQLHVKTVVVARRPPARRRGERR